LREERRREDKKNTRFQTAEKRETDRATLRTLFLCTLFKERKREIQTKTETDRERER
jgi:hypothetical protein